MFKKILVFYVALICFSPVSIALTETPKQTKQINRFIDHMVKQHDFKRTQLNKLFAQMKLNQQIIDSLHHPYETKPWDIYRQHFITQKRIKGGVWYWHQHANALVQAAKKYGVAPSVIVAIIGVETNYSKNPGAYSAFDTLGTLAFFQKSRTHFFKSELKALLLLAREQKFKVRDLKGSYAGALGIPQFMPSAYRTYGVSFNGRKVNLFTNHADAIMSIANFLKQNGDWQRHQPIASPATIKGRIKQRFISEKGEPRFTVHQLAHQGIVPKQPASPTDRAAVIVIVDNHHKKHYWMVYQNFHAIMAYNPRINYALAVYQLSQQIKNRYGQKKT